jgi:hypothetical protein
LCDKTRKPGKAPIDEALKNKLCRTACSEKPKNATHGSIRRLAKKFGVSKTAVITILPDVI